LIGDKAYDADPFVEILTQRGISPVIPPKDNRKIKRACDFALYCERNLVERFFNLLEHFRAIATRYDKIARNFSCRSTAGRCYNPAQLNTGPSMSLDLPLSKERRPLNQ
jgi:transposase